MMRHVTKVVQTTCKEELGCRMQGNVGRRQMASASSVSDESALCVRTTFTLILLVNLMQL